MQNEIIRLSRIWSKYRQFWDFIEQQEQNHPDFVIPDEFIFFLTETGDLVFYILLFILNLVHHYGSY